ncbi:MAG: hypothetical protein V8R91_12710 [Butyricimonas faecihominis]
MIPLLSGIYWLQLEKDEIPSQMTVGNPGIIPGGYKAILITAQGKAITLLPSAGKRYLRTRKFCCEKWTNWYCLPRFEKGCFYVTI